MLEQIIRTCSTLPPQQVAQILEEAQKYFKIRQCESRNWAKVCQYTPERQCNLCQNGYKTLKDKVEAK